MAKETGDQTKARLTALEVRVTVLEAQARNAKPRKKREYTQEERTAIRTRLLAGQEAKRKRLEAEAKAKPKAKAETAKPKGKKIIITQKA